MERIETPEDFFKRIWCKTSFYSEYKAEMIAEITARDAALRVEADALLKTCGEALEAVPKIMESFEYTPDEDSCTGQSIFKAKLNEDGFFIALSNARAALAALREAGVIG